MPKKSKITRATSTSTASDVQSSIVDEVMQRVRSGAVVMKPRWYFVLGSVLASLSLAGLTITTLFFTHLTVFFFRSHGPMAQWRLEMMLNTFPWWMPVVAILGLVVAAWMLRRFDFSYKHNFGAIVAVFIVGLVLAVWIIEVSGIAETWARRSPMRRLYYQRMMDPEGDLQFPGRGRMMMRYRTVQSSPPIIDL